MYTEWLLLKLRHKSSSISMHRISMLAFNFVIRINYTEVHPRRRSLTMPNLSIITEATITYTSWRWKLFWDCSPSLLQLLTGPIVPPVSWSLICDILYIAKVKIVASWLLLSWSVWYYKHLISTPWFSAWWISRSTRGLSRRRWRHQQRRR